MLNTIVCFTSSIIRTSFPSTAAIAIQSLFSVIMTAFIMYYSEAPKALQSVWKCVLILATLDIITGSMYAFLKGKFKTGIFTVSGLKRFIGYVVVLGMAAAADGILQQPYTTGLLAAFYIAANEAASIIENCNKMKIPIPKFLVDFVAVLRSKYDDDTIEDVNNNDECEGK